jgi:DnaK suppressor protein
MATPKKKATAGSSKPTRTAEHETPSSKATARKPGEVSKSKAAAPEPRTQTQEKAPPKPVPGIDPQLVEEIKTALLHKKNELGSNVNNELDDMREAAEGHHLADMDDLGGDAHDEETQYKIMEIESAELGQIDEALERISTGTFGVCEDCEKPIAAERLRALPFANHCIACKRTRELNED